MIDIKAFIKDPDHIAMVINERGVNCDIKGVLASYRSMNLIKTELENARAEINEISKKLSKKPDKQLITQAGVIKKNISSLKKEFDLRKKEYLMLADKVPNDMAEDTPIGKTDKNNLVIKHWGKPDLTKKQNHLEIGESFNLIDFELGTKVSGHKFYFLKNDAVLLELALINFAIDKAVKRGYIPLITPDLALDHVISAMGFSPRGKETQIYSIENTDISLIGTSEITVGGMLMGKLLDNLPRKFVSLSHCFRTEAGSYGRESKGLYRVHQFTKVELFHFSKPSDSDRELTDIVGIEEEIYQDLCIPYRLVRVSAGDLGAPAYKKYDIEAWMPGKNGYGEVTSASNCTDFQARRLNIKTKEGKKRQYIHTLNGTAIASSRTIICILENGFNKEKNLIEIPKKLQPYMRGKKVIFPHKG